MTQWTLVLTTVLILANQSLAAPPRGKPEVRLESTAPCVECLKSGVSSMDSIQKFIKEMKGVTNGALDIEVISNKMNYNNKCDNFAARGEINKWGVVVKEEISRPKYSTLLSDGPKDIVKYCPNFKNMNLSERKDLNVLIVTAMAHYESSCDFREKAPGPNGTAAGLLQLHKGREHIYSSGCRKGDSGTAERSLVCGLSMLNDQIERGENLFSSSSYWEVLRPSGSSRKATKIMAAISKFPACSLSSNTKVGSAKRNEQTWVAQK